MRKLLLILFIAIGAVLSASSADKGDFSVFWWGTDIRSSGMKSAIDEYQGRHPDISMYGRSTEWTGYWPMLAMRAAGSSLPDVMLMDLYYIEDYKASGLLLPLGEFIEDGTLPPIDESLSCGSDDGGIYGYPMGLTAPVMFYDKRVTDAAGVQIPEKMTFSEFKEIANIIYQRVGVPALCDGGLNALVFYARALALDPFESIANGNDAAVRQLFHDIEEFSAEDYSVPIGNLAGKDLNVPDRMPITDLTSWNAYGFVNQVEIFASFSGFEEIGYTVPPVPDDAVQDPMYTKPCVFLSISAKTSNPYIAADFISEMAERSSDGQLFGEMGLPAAREDFEDALSRMPEYLQDAYSFVKLDYPMIESFEKGAGSLEDILLGYTDSIRTGELSADEATDLFMEDAMEILKP